MIPGVHDVWLFVLSALLLNITPGPDTLYIIGRSSSQGLKAGVLAALGIGASAMVHVAAAALGLSALLTTSAMAFTIVKAVGAAYLIYVGVGLVRGASRAERADAPLALAPAVLCSVFLQGFFTNLLNPKVALFFLAFLPQFVAADAPSKSAAFLFLGVLFDVNGTLWNLLLAWSSARLSAQLAPSARLRAWFNRGVGSVFIVVGLRLALSRR